MRIQRHNSRLFPGRSLEKSNRPIGYRLRHRDVIHFCATGRRLHDSLAVQLLERPRNRVGMRAKLGGQDAAGWQRLAGQLRMAHPRGMMMKLSEPTARLVGAALWIRAPADPIGRMDLLHRLLSWDPARARISPGERIFVLILDVLLGNTP